jgi:hypothetical protein
MEKKEEKLNECVVCKEKVCDEEHKRWEKYVKFNGYTVDERAEKQIERKVKDNCPHRVDGMCGKGA